MSKKVLVICGTGVATSTVVAIKIKDFCSSRGIPVVVTQGKVMDIVRGIEGYDLIVATTPIPSTVKIPVIQGLSFLTGIGNEATLEKIAQALS
ncbi:PTS sugar transporter subunit IIB [Actinomycetes bacterium]|jgi:PTS system galactitol-specific IIB component|nr:MAG: PTS galactitol transporter subunit IIB [Streptomycetaceae bacterium]GDX24820.1 PTS sugar transporter subunit IIB [Actinomycetes bacterium]